MSLRVPIYRGEAISVGLLKDGDCHAPFKIINVVAGFIPASSSPLPRWERVRVRVNWAGTRPAPTVALPSCRCEARLVGAQDEGRDSFAPQMEIAALRSQGQWCSDEAYPRLCCLAEAPSLCSGRRKGFLRASNGDCRASLAMTRGWCQERGNCSAFSAMTV